jgi:hypothetical protein
MAHQKGTNGKTQGVPLSNPSVQGKGAISRLQEFVQRSQTFQIPANYPVLQWEFESQMSDSATLEFRAIVAFLLEGVPHHVAGDWQAKKKDAQRDTAERALGFFESQWGERLARKEGSAVAAKLHAIGQSKMSTSGAELPSPPEASLEEHCRTLDECGGIPPVWTFRWSAGQCFATVELTLLGVPHKLAGAAADSEAEARIDVSERALWYLQCPGYQNNYEPDPAAPAIATMKIPAPATDWARDPALDGAIEVAQRKTAIMRVQNRLQQKFSRQLKPGFSVWEWTYEADPTDEDWPSLYRASVSIPVIGNTFTGVWARGQRDAQLEAIQHVVRLLDQLDNRE